ncbi:hypothetical protein D3C73_605410 [compost metagenome]
MKSVDIPVSIHIGKRQIRSRKVQIGVISTSEMLFRSLYPPFLMCLLDDLHHGWNRALSGIISLTCEALDQYTRANAPSLLS